MSNQPGILAKTPEGLFIIIDISSFLPGREINPDYIRESEGGGKPFFFIPSDWNEENGKMNQFSYSIGYSSVEAALKDATEWEASRHEREPYP